MGMGIGMEMGVGNRCIARKALCHMPRPHVRLVRLTAIICHGPQTMTHVQTFS
jgi:hypothetical protein